MFDIILLIIILIALIHLIIQNSENMTDHNFKYLNSKSSVFVTSDLYANNEQIEISTLANCSMNFIFDYGSNYNNIINNEISIYQDIINPLEHTIELDNINYNLTSVRWKLSKFTYNNMNVGLDLHLVHQNFNSIYKLIIVIPLSLTGNNIVPYSNEKETFKNIGYNNFVKDIVTDTNLTDTSTAKFIEPAYYQVKDKTEILINSKKNLFNLNIINNNKNFSLNKLITTPLMIPDYECCGNKIGQSVRFNLCDIQQLLQKNKKYYQLEDKEANKYFITEPLEFNEEIGLNIMNKISYDNSIFYLKKN